MSGRSLELDDVWACVSMCRGGNALCSEGAERQGLCGDVCAAAADALTRRAANAKSHANHTIKQLTVGTIGLTASRATWHINSLNPRRFIMIRTPSLRVLWVPPRGGGNDMSKPKIGEVSVLRCRRDAGLQIWIAKHVGQMQFPLLACHNKP